MTITRAFGVTFALAVASEIARSVLGAVPLVNDIIFVFGYVLLVALGFMLALGGLRYSKALANTWPFVVLWFLAGILNLRLGASPPDWSAQDQANAYWGYVIATIMFLPLAFGASAFGVWLGRIVCHRRPPSSNAA